MPVLGKDEVEDDETCDELLALDKEAKCEETWEETWDEALTLDDDDTLDDAELIWIPILALDKEASDEVEDDEKLDETRDELLELELELELELDKEAKWEEALDEVLILDDDNTLDEAELIWITTLALDNDGDELKLESDPPPPPPQALRKPETRTTYSHLKIFFIRKTSTLMEKLARQRSKYNNNSQC